MIQNHKTIKAEPEAKVRKKMYNYSKIRIMEIFT